MVSYTPLFIQMAKRGIKKTELCDTIGFSRNVLTRVDNGQYISLRKIEMMCKFFNCSIQDIVTFVDDE